VRIYRYEVPVDDNHHVIELEGDPLHVGCRRIDVVEFWAIAEGGPAIRRRFTVVGTGHPFDEGHRYVAPGGQLVWHLLEDVLDPAVGGAS
jgi:hypothetical protein